MKKAFVFVAAAGLLCVGGIAQANVFDLGAGYTNLETVTVDDPGNAGDKYGASRGAVSYTYNIGKYEVTAKQYTDFLNAKAKTDTYGLYSPNMYIMPYGCKIQRSGTSGNYTYSVADDFANRPVNYVSLWDACRFSNWLNNSQGDGDTEIGVYTMSGYDYQQGRIQRNADWKWAVADSDEWYKAAYYKGGGTNAGYWLYAMQSDETPSNKVLPVDPGNSANFFNYGYSIGFPILRSNVGEFENSASAYGTYDQSGNVSEWTDTPTFHFSSLYYCHGGSYDSPIDNIAKNALKNSQYYAYEDANIGFRVVQAVPEPSSIIALAGGLLPLIGLKRRKA